MRRRRRPRLPEDWKTLLEDHVPPPSAEPVPDQDPQALLTALTADPERADAARALASLGRVGLAALTPGDPAEELTLAHVRAGIGDPAGTDRLVELLDGERGDRAARILFSLRASLPPSRLVLLLRHVGLPVRSRHVLLTGFAETPELLMPFIADRTIGDPAGMLATRTAVERADLELLGRLASHPGRPWTATALCALMRALPYDDAVRILRDGTVTPWDRDAAVRTLLRRDDLPQAALFGLLHREGLAEEETLVEAASSDGTPTVTLLAVRADESLPRPVRDAATITLLARAGEPPAPR